MISNLLLVIVIFVVIYLTYTFSGLRRFIRNAREINKLDGPPLLGTITQTSMKPGDIYESVRYLAKTYGPTYRVWLSVMPCVNTLCPEDARILLSNMKHITKGPFYKLASCWLKTGVLMSTGEKWHHRRKLLTPSFHFNILPQYVDIFNKHTIQLIKNLENVNEDETEVTAIISEYVLCATCEIVMGIDATDGQISLSGYKKHLDEFSEICISRIINPWLLIDTIFALTEKGKQGSRTCKYLHEFSTSAIKKRAELPKKNTQQNHENIPEHMGRYSKTNGTVLLDRLQSLDRVVIDDKGIKEEVDTLIFAGHDTTTLALSYCLMLLACNRKCQEKVYEEIIEVLSSTSRNPTFSDVGKMRYLERCIKEVLRLYPIVPFLSRTCDGMTTSAGYKIPKGSVVNVVVQDMHRSPTLFSNPEMFDPDRFLPENEATRHPFAYIPFSAGPRRCLGQRFAMLEIKCCLTAIMKNFILEPIDTPDTIHLIPTILLRPENGIRVKFVHRSESRKDWKSTSCKKTTAASNFCREKSQERRQDMTG